MESGDHHDWPQQCTKYNPKYTALKGAVIGALRLVRTLAKQVTLCVRYKAKTCAKDNEKADKGRVGHRFYLTGIK